jgi:hypothetical protein
MYKITANGNRPAHGVKKYLVDTFNDLAEIKLTDAVASGSTAFASKEDKWYVLDLHRKWVAMKAPGGGGSEDDDPDEGDVVIYEGGDI